MGPMNGSGMCEAVALGEGPLVGGGHWRSRSVGKVVALGEPPLVEPWVGKVGFHAHHLARHFGLSSAQVAIPVGKEGLLVSHLARSPSPPCPPRCTTLPTPWAVPYPNTLITLRPNLGLRQKNITFASTHYALVVEW